MYDGSAEDYDLANQMDHYYPIAVRLSSYFSVLSHWVFSMKYFSTSLILPKLFSYIHINLMEDKFTDELEMDFTQRSSYKVPLKNRNLEVYK